MRAARPNLHCLHSGRLPKPWKSKIADLFSEDEGYDVNSADKSLLEKMKMIEGLSEEDQKTIFNILDAFVGKKKLKDTLSSVLQDV